MCIDIVAICFGTANGQILSCFTELSAHHMTVAGYYHFMFFFFFFFFFFSEIELDIFHRNHV